MWSTTLHQGQRHSFLFFCYVLLDDIPPFRNSEFYLSVTRKYCFPTSFDNYMYTILYVSCYKYRYTLCRDILYVDLHLYALYTYTYTYYTSSTAQGGGGSFKNRKPIGEIGCCESGMAERSHWWTERCLISLTLSLSFSDYLPAYQPIFYVSTYLSHYRSF